MVGSGCVRRRMLIRSNPPGALVYVDDYEIGRTPIATNFTYYGQRKIRLVKDGYETLTVMQPVRAPWYQIPPLDFFSENLTPAEIRDEQAFTYNLTPQVIVPPDELLSKAQRLRQATHAAATPAPAVAPTRLSPGPPGPPPGGPLPVPESGPAPPFQPQVAPGTGGYPVHPLPPSGR
jgi:hypothetical protein